MNEEWLSSPIHEDEPVVQPYTGSPYDPYDGDGAPEFGPPCPKCKAEMDWMDCDTCGGQGGFNNDELMEDDPLWYEGVEWEQCETCLGDGGWWYCGNCGHTVTEAELTEESELHQQEEPGVRQS